MTARRKPPWDELDPGIVPLVAALSSFPGLQTIGSCEGHDDPKPGGWAKGSWYVKFRVDRSAHGWRSLEFLSWVVNNDGARSGRQARIYPDSPAPYLNTPGDMLAFAFEHDRPGGVMDEDDSPQRWAEWIERLADEYYVPATLRQGLAWRVGDLRARFDLWREDRRAEDSLRTEDEGQGV